MNQEIREQSDRSFSSAVPNASEPIDGNSMLEERLFQSRIRFYLACMIIALSAVLSFTIVVLFCSGQISGETATKAIDLIVKIIAPYSIKLM